MAVEIEMKFLVANGSWKQGNREKTIDIKQGYLQKSRAQTVRVRLTKNTTNIRQVEKTAYLTIKGATKNLSRDEFEYEIPYDDGVSLLKMCSKPYIRKTRHCVRDVNNQLWEIEMFKGINDGLVLAEIELDSESQTVILPDWIGRDVSHDRRYTNVYLVDHEVPHC